MAVSRNGKIANENHLQVLLLQTKMYEIIDLLKITHRSLAL